MMAGVQRRSWVALGLAIVALGLGFVDRAVDADLASWTGILWLAALILFVAGLSFWRRILPDVPAMPGLFQPLGPGQRWCARCGTPAEGRDPCGVCGHAPKPPRSKKEKPAKAGKSKS